MLVWEAAEPSTFASMQETLATELCRCITFYSLVLAILTHHFSYAILHMIGQITQIK